MHKAWLYQLGAFYLNLPSIPKLFCAHPGDLRALLEFPVEMSLTKEGDRLSAFSFVQN